MYFLCSVCKTKKEKWVLYNNEHYSQHMFDKYSISHIYAGIIYSLIFVKPLYVFIASTVFECIENSSYVADQFRKAGWDNNYDTFINIFGDTVSVMFGYLIYSISTNKLKLVVMMIIFEILLSTMDQMKDYTLTHTIIRSFTKVSKSTKDIK